MKNNNENKNGFTQIPNEFLGNKELTLQQKAMLIILKSNSEIWDTHMNEIYSRSKNSPRSQAKVKDELVKLGYIRCTDERKLKKGKFSYKWEFNLDGSFLTDTPKPYDGKRHTDIPTAVKPTTEKPLTEKHTTNNTNENNTNGNNKKENKNKEISIRKEDEKPIADSTNGEKEFNPPTLQEVVLFFEGIGSNASAANAFFNEFNIRKWFDRKGNQVENWKGLAKYFSESNADKYFEITNEEKKLIRDLAESLRIRIVERILANPNARENEHLMFTTSDVNKCLLQLCTEQRLDTYEKLYAYLVENKVNLNSYWEFKKSLGIGSISGTGTKYI